MSIWWARPVKRKGATMRPLHRGRLPHRNSKGTAFRLFLYIGVFSCVMNTRYGPSGENRTHGLLNPIQARYQNCATPGYLQAAYRLQLDEYTRSLRLCQGPRRLFSKIFPPGHLCPCRSTSANYFPSGILSDHFPICSIHALRGSRMRCPFWNFCSEISIL